jgi:hypothetical protein
MDDPTIIRTFSDRGEAEIARSLLEAEGIDAAISADDMGGTTPPLDLSAGLQLVVSARDVEQARELLDETFSGEDFAE